MTLNLVLDAPGTYVIEDDGIVGNNVSVVRDVATGAIVDTFTHPADALRLFCGTGVNLIVNFTDALGPADFEVGMITDLNESPESLVVQHVETWGRVTLTARGSIGEGIDSDAAADIITTQLIMSAGTGIGTPANALETQIAVIEAETGTGGINIRNFNALSPIVPAYVQIGGLTDAVNGLQVFNSGDITFVNEGSIVFRDFDLDPSTFEPLFGAVRGGSVSGDINLTAQGVEADIRNEANGWSVWGRSGDVTLNAGRDIILGTFGDTQHDVRAAQDLFITAGRDLTIDGVVRIVANDGPDAGGSANIVTGRSINVLAQFNSAAGISGGGGRDVTLTTGLLRLDPAGNVAVVGGDVTFNVDRLNLNPVSGISVSGTLTLAPRTDGRPIYLGSGFDSATGLDISNAELGRMFTNRIVVGSYESGPVTVVADISPGYPGFFTTLDVRSGTNINLLGSVTTSTATGSTAALVLSARDNVFQDAGSTITTRNLSVFADAVDDDPGVGGVTLLNGNFTTLSLNLIGGNLDWDRLDGSAIADRLLGFGGNDVLRGFRGNDILDGGAGVDAMSGGLGNDTYNVDNNNDVVTEAAGEGDDTLSTSITYALAAGSEVETIVTANPQGTAVIALSGNAFAQSIFGNDGINSILGFAGNDNLVGFAGNDTLDGGSGNDVMRGGLGNDTVVIDSAADQVFETVGEGDDLVRASAGYTLAAGVEVETIMAMTAANLTLTGNEFGQSIFGNAGIDTLNGAGGNDQLLGFGDNDTLVGGAGVDVMRGGTGNDGYNVDNAGDLVFENVGEGDDSVSAGVSYALAAGVSVETLATTNAAGVGAIDLRGNDFGQSIFGNEGVNLLNGDGGIDVLNGFGGNDVLIGGSGSDVLNGGAGRDDYRFNTSLNAATNVDTIIGFVTVTDGISLDDAVFTALAPGALPSGAFRTGAAAQDADDRILYDSTTGAVFYDPDGVGGADQVQFATLQGAPALAGSDFIVI